MQAVDLSKNHDRRNQHSTRCAATNHSAAAVTRDLHCPNQRSILLFVASHRVIIVGNGNRRMHNFIPILRNTALLHERSNHFPVTAKRQKQRLCLFQRSNGTAAQFLLRGIRTEEINGKMCHFLFLSLVPRSRHASKWSDRLLPKKAGGSYDSMSAHSMPPHGHTLRLRQ